MDNIINTKTTQKLFLDLKLNAQAVADYLRQKLGQIILIMAGDRGNDVAEDSLCAEVIEQKLLGLLERWGLIKKEVSDFTQKYYSPTIAQNIHLLLDFPDSFQIVPRCFSNSEGFIQLEAVSSPNP